MYFTTLSSVGCALIEQIIDIINRVFNLVISTKIKNLLITNILICNVNLERKGRREKEEILRVLRGEDGDKGWELGRGRRLPPVHPLMYVEVCSVCMSFYAHANTLKCRKMLNPELILYFETIPIDLSPTSVSSSRVCLK